MDPVLEFFRNFDWGWVPGILFIMVLVLATVAVVFRFVTNPPKETNETYKL